jgi:dTDP-4-amino-4,6-dideoxygalactose transaminase
LDRRFRLLRQHGMSVSDRARHQSATVVAESYECFGFNYRMTDVQAAIGRVQLRKLDGFVAERDRWARWYSERLRELGWLAPPEVPEGRGPAWQAYVTVLAEDAPLPRLEVMRGLHARGIATRPGTHAVTELGLYRRRLGDAASGFPVARRLHERSLALPLHNRMSEDDYTYVVDCLAEL